jgi:uncharacterized protein (DUF433 family)
MIKKTKVTVWQTSHTHHDSRSRLLKLSRWGRLYKPYEREQSEELATVGHAASQYPKDVANSFEDALRRCPSVSIDAEIMEGQPCIGGTRIPVRAVLRAIEQYGNVQDVVTCYPHLTVEQVEDALYFSQVVLELPSGLDETTVAT